MEDTPSLTLDQAWAKIQPHLDRLFSLMDGGLENLPPTVFTLREHAEAYSVVYKLCLSSPTTNDGGAQQQQNTSAILYSRYESTLRAYLRDRMVGLIQQKQSLGLLQEFSSRYRIFTALSRWFGKFFNYLDRFHVSFTSALPLRKLALKCFQEEVFDQVKQSVAREVLALVAKERTGAGDADAHLLKQCIDVFVAMDAHELSVYQQDFELAFLLDTKNFYDARAEEWISSNSTPQYLLCVEQAIGQEDRRVDAYLVATSTQQKVRDLIAQCCLQEQELALLQNDNSGLRVLLQQDKRDDLGRVFRMFAMLADRGGLEPVARMVEEHIRAEGKVVLDQRQQALDENADTEQHFIHALLQLHDKFHALVVGEFEMNNLLQKALKQAFEQTVNTDLGKQTNAELMAAFADSILKTGGGASGGGGEGGAGSVNAEREMEDLLEKVVQLFAYLSDKDVFVEVYRSLLAKRLLNQRSASPFAEKSMIQKLKLKCGHQFTSKLEGMLTDLSLGQDVQQRFQQHVQKLQSSAVAADRLPFDAFSCEVLTTGHWPSFKLLDLALPQDFERCIDAYLKFYGTVTEHRKLTWVHSLGKATVKGHFKQTYDFEVTTLQAVVLLLFNDNSSGGVFSLQQVVDRLSLKDQVEVVKKTLHSLACNKVHVLNKTPAGRRIDDGDVFEVDAAFQCKIRKIKLPAASLDENVSTQRIEEDRSMAIEACIVRVMKSRKFLQHNVLISEVTQQLMQFRPNPKLIKKKIEHLIERDYLARDDKDSSFYNYLA